jgi:hypothetical protein
MSKEVSMKAGLWVLASTLVLFSLLGTEAEADRTLREFSGDAMQRSDSQMMASPVARAFGIPFWPSYPTAPSMTIVNIQIYMPELNQPPKPPPTPPAPSKFWTAQCGVFVEIQVSSTINLMEEEAKPCSR